MVRLLKVVLVVLFVLFAFSPLNVLLAMPISITTLTDRIGDKDGFGLNVQKDQIFQFDDLPLLTSGQLTDGWTTRNFLPLGWEHAIDLSVFSTITGASLEIFSGGQGKFGSSRLMVDGELVGLLTDGEIGGSNFARRDTFDLLPFIDLLGDGRASVMILTQFQNGKFFDPDGQSPADNWVLDYSQLTVRGFVETVPAPVPEPSSILLLSMGIIGLFTFGRRVSQI